MPERAAIAQLLGAPGILVLLGWLKVASAVPLARHQSLHRKESVCCVTIVF